MTYELIRKLYTLGKSVYENKMDMGKAVFTILAEFPELISESSAKFYIGLVNELLIGKGSTWNQNSDLLVYYVEKIYEDYGKKSAENAYQGAIKFALSKSRKPLIQELNKIKDKYDLKVKSNIAEEKQVNIWWPSISEYTPGLSKEKWIELLQDPIVFTDSALNVMALFYANGGQGSALELEQKYGNTPNYYRMTCVHLAERVIKATDCTMPPEVKNSKWWPVLFVGRETEQDEIGDYIWRLREELYDALTEVDILKYLPKGGEEELSDKEIITKVKEYIASKGFTYDDSLIDNFYLSLKSKPFVILAGTSGTGKSKLVKLFAEALGATSDKSNGRYKLVAVRPDWSDSSDLFGHKDLNGNFIPGEITKFVATAEKNTGKPYFLCLDEMNLARVEYYLSDVLSIMETRESVNGKITTDKIKIDGYGELTLPENLYIIGTVNMDETTFPFSKKVLDRANTIEFSYVDLIPDFSGEASKQTPVNASNNFLKTEYLYLKQCPADECEEIKAICEELQKINEILWKANAHIGYRVRDEIVFYMLNNKKADLLQKEKAFDNEILQKILPRIQGSSSAVRDMLCELFKFCADNYDGYRSDSGEISKKMFKLLEEEPKTVKYRKSADKLAYMMRRYEEDGFTSYWL